MAEISPGSRLRFPGLSGRILRRHDAKLLAVRANHAYFTCADPLIHLNKAFIYAILLNPPGKLTLLVELRGAPHTCGKTVKIIAWVDGRIAAARRTGATPAIGFRIR